MLIIVLAAPAAAFALLLFGSYIRALVAPGHDVLGALIFTLVALPWGVLLFYTTHEEGCPAAAKEAAWLYSPLLHAALVTAYAGPPWFVLGASGEAARLGIGTQDALTHRRLQWIIMSRLLPVYVWLYAFLYNYRHDDVAVFVAFIMFGMCCVECRLVGCGGRAALAMAVQMAGAVGLVAISAEDARLCGERVL